MLDDDLNSIKQEEKEEVIEVQEPQTSTMDRNDPCFG